MKKKLITISILLFSSGIFAQGVYNNGGKIVIGSGIYFCISGTGGNYRNETNGTNASIDLSGTLKIEGNYTNNVAGSDILATVAPGSEVAFNGTAAQTLGGTTTSPFTFDKLTVNNNSGITLSKDVLVNNIMTFSNGLVKIGSNNLTLGASATIAGTPSLSSMIVATGTGEVRKVFSSTGSFTFPVGDSNLTAKYSPVTLNITTGTFAAGAYAGINLVNSAYSDPLITGSYLNRYWNITQSGISVFTCDAVFQYLPIDVTGTESDIYGVMISPAPAAFYTAVDAGLHQFNTTGLTSFGTFTGAAAFKHLGLTVFLEGPYNSATGIMNTDLNTNNLIPLNQPFNTAPWNYSGTESVTSIPANVVDWVLVELRDAATPGIALPGTKLSGWPKACFLKSDGSIVDLDGTSLPNIGNPTITNSLFAVVRHRNHIAIMSNTGLTLTGNSYIYNFTTAVTQAYGGSAGYKQISASPSVYGMVAGDVNSDGSIFTSDYTPWATAFGNMNSYQNGDIDMDGNDFSSDYIKWATNFGDNNPIGLMGGTIPKYKSQVP